MKAKQQRKKEIKVQLAKGKRHFVIHQGLIGWGIPSYLIYLALNLAVQMWLEKWTFFHSARMLFPFPILIGLVLFAIASVFVGNYRWKQLLKEAGGKSSPKTAKK